MFLKIEWSRNRGLFTVCFCVLFIWILIEFVRIPNILRNHITRGLQKLISKWIHVFDLSFSSLLQENNESYWMNNNHFVFLSMNKIWFKCHERFCHEFANWWDLIFDIYTFSLSDIIIYYYNQSWMNESGLLIFLSMLYRFSN